MFATVPTLSTVRDVGVHLGFFHGVLSSRRTIPSSSDRPGRYDIAQFQSVARPSLHYQVLQEHYRATAVNRHHHNIGAEEVADSNLADSNLADAHCTLQAAGFQLAALLLCK